MIHKLVSSREIDMFIVSRRLKRQSSSLEEFPQWEKERLQYMYHSNTIVTVTASHRQTFLYVWSYK
jgi:hypothetical protein